MSERLNVLKTYKLYVGGKFPRSESGRVYEVTDAKGKWLANAPLSSRKDARDAVVAAPRRSAAGPARRRTTAPDPLPDRRDAGGPPRSVRGGGRRRRGPVEVEGGGAGRRRDRPLGLVRGAGPTRSPRWSAAATRSRAPFFNLSSPEPTGVVAVLAPQESSLLGLVSVVAPVIATGNTGGRGGVGEVAPPRPSPWARSWPPPTSPGGVVEHPHRPYGRDRHPPRLPPGRQRDRPHRGPTRRWRRSWRSRRPTTSKRVLRPQPVDDADWSATPGTDRMTAFLETKTVWHPTGALGASGSSY